MFITSMVLFYDDTRRQAGDPICIGTRVAGQLLPKGAIPFGFISWEGLPPSGTPDGEMVERQRRRNAALQTLVDDGGRHWAVDYALVSSFTKEQHELYGLALEWAWETVGCEWGDGPDEPAGLL